MLFLKGKQKGIDDHTCSINMIISALFDDKIFRIVNTKIAFLSGILTKFFKTQYLWE